MGAGAADWKITPKAILKGDFEYQHKVERSVSGYQLLGGNTVPDLDRIYRDDCLRTRDPRSREGERVSAWPD